MSADIWRRALLEHADMARTLQPGDVIGSRTVEEVTIDTVTYEDDGWYGTCQVPWIRSDGTPFERFRLFMAKAVES